jgi:hypothetical protein
MLIDQRRVLWPLALVGLALLAVAWILALQPVVIGDTYCGRVLFDTRPCGGRMATSRTSSLVLGCGSVAMLAVALRHQILRAPMVAVLGLIAALLLIVAGNRLLQPVSDPWCGSVLNRHRYYDAALESRCDHVVAPYRRAGVRALGGGAAALALALGALVLPGTTWARPTG